MLLRNSRCLFKTSFKQNLKKHIVTQHGEDELQNMEVMDYDGTYTFARNDGRFVLFTTWFHKFRIPSFQDFFLIVLIGTSLFNISLKLFPADLAIACLVNISKQGVCSVNQFDQILIKLKVHFYLVIIILKYIYAL